MTSNSLTSGQVETLAFIEAYIARHRISPSVREICRGLGLKSLDTTHARLTALRDNGFIEWRAGQSRTIRLTERVPG